MSRLVLPTRALLIACAVLLTACGGSPSEAQIKEALQADMKRSQEQAAASARMLLGEQAAEKAKQLAATNVGEIKDVHKIGCKDDGEKAYRCDFEVEVSRNGQTQKSPPISARFIKGSDGWQAQR